jgi:hypothetical protein
MHAAAAGFWNRATPKVVERHAGFDRHDAAEDKETVTMSAADQIARVLEVRRDPTPTLVIPRRAAPAPAPAPLSMSRPALALSATAAAGFLLVAGFTACASSVIVVVSLAL